MKKILAVLIVLAMSLTVLVGCTPTDAPEVTTTAAENTTTEPNETTTTEPNETTTAEPQDTTTGDDSEIDDPLADVPCVLNGVDLAAYTIVYDADGADYVQRAAAYIGAEIAERTGITLTVTSDAEQTEPLAHEIVVGDTSRAISAALDAETEGFEFAFLADGAHVAMEGDYFVIAAAAYYFIETYVTGETFRATLSTEETVCTPIVKEAENFIFLIGDGMGVSQTMLVENYKSHVSRLPSDNETQFYGYMFPYVGFSRTDSLSGTTDSAAGGTALASGYKTKNDRVGIDSSGRTVQSLTELAGALGKSTAVMSTEVLTGATPASFSAHTQSRGDTDEILADQANLSSLYGTLILGEYADSYTAETFAKMEKDITDTLTALSQNEEGFFIMYEEAYIDKHSHSNDSRSTFYAMLRFNQAIGLFMEYAFYNPETFVLITADHETGGLTKQDDGRYVYTTGDHTSADVPVFAYGVGAEVFHGVTVENIQIPKTLSKMWGYQLPGYDDENYPALDLGA